MVHLENSEPTHELAAILDVAISAANKAGEILLKYYGKAGIHQKSSHNLVTEADFESEKAVRELILNAFPNHRILGEEGGDIGGSDVDSLWIVDPLDGTNNYAHGIPQFSVSIAFSHQGTMQVGVVLDPMRNELFTAVFGQGAKLNGQPITVSASTDLTESMIATGFYYDRGEMMEKTLDAIRRLFNANIRGIRRLGSAALDIAWVACGRLEGFFEYQLSPWDYAAGALIVREAGGECFDRLGNYHDLDSGNIVTTNGKISQAMLNCVHWETKT